MFLFVMCSLFFSFSPCWNREGIFAGSPGTGFFPLVVLLSLSLLPRSTIMPSKCDFIAWDIQDPEVWLCTNNEEGGEMTLSGLPDHASHGSHSDVKTKSISSLPHLKTSQGFLWGFMQWSPDTYAGCLSLQCTGHSPDPGHCDFSCSHALFHWRPPSFILHI